MLMSVDRRKVDRLPWRLHVVVDVGEGESRLCGIAQDISERGVFVLFPRPLPEGCRVNLHISSPEQNMQPVSVCGIVVYVVLGVGMGIRFSRPEVRTRQLIHLLVQRRRQELAKAGT